jgi:hypothetical protein
MSRRLPRILAALSGILGIALLGVYFGAAPPLPPANATVAQVASVATQYHDSWFLGAWVQATGSLLSVVFFLALVHMAGAASRFAGTLTFLGSTVLLAVVLVEGAFTIDLAQAAANGHAETALTSYDIMSVFIHIYPIVPAPLIFLSLGTVLLGSRLLPRALGYLAFALGVAYAIVGLVGLFTTPILTLVILGAQSFWVLAAAITLALRADKPATTPAAQPA